MLLCCFHMLDYPKEPFRIVRSLIFSVILTLMFYFGTNSISRKSTKTVVGFSSAIKSSGTCSTGFYCRGETDYSFGGFPRDGICTKIEHEGQYHTEYERSDNPEWHKSVPTCDNSTYEISTTTTSHPNNKAHGSKSKITFKGLPI